MQVVQVKQVTECTRPGLASGTPFFSLSRLGNLGKVLGSTLALFSVNVLF